MIGESMLEDLAYKFINRTEGEITQIGIVLVVIGFIVALIRNSQTKAELQRAPYFVYASLLYFFGSALFALWLFTPQAMAYGILWVLVGLTFGAIAVLGYFYGLIGLARSRDAFGSGRYAFLGLLPLINLVLIARPSKKTMSPERIPTIPLATGGIGVISGIVLVFLGGSLSAVIEDQLNEMASNTPADESIASSIQFRGLEGTLKAMVTQMQLPIKVDGVTTLDAVEVKGMRLVRNYIVTRKDFVVSDNFLSRLEDALCASEPLVSLMAEGAIIEEVYLRADGSLAGRHIITQKSCAP
jgi:hypothetical protein